MVCSELTEKETKFFTRRTESENWLLLQYFSHIQIAYDSKNRNMIQFA